jgi:hypothetical protein
MSDEKPDEAGTSAAGASPGGTAEADLPRIDLSTFVLSLAASAMIHLGEAPGPEGEKRETPDLPMARQVIDTLEMLAEKTRGNLDADEEHLLQSVLYEVRMIFVRVERGR